jgi:hypothetical protein
MLDSRFIESTLKAIEKEGSDVLGESWLDEPERRQSQALDCAIQPSGRVELDMMNEAYELMTVNGELFR